MSFSWTALPRCSVCSDEFPSARELTQHQKETDHGYSLSCKVTINIKNVISFQKCNDLVRCVTRSSRPSTLWGLTRRWCTATRCPSSARNATIGSRMRWSCFLTLSLFAILITITPNHSFANTVHFAIIFFISRAVWEGTRPMTTSTVALRGKNLVSLIW